MAVRTAAASALLLLAACIAAVSADGGEDAPKMELSDGNLVWSLQQGKTVSALTIVVQVPCPLCDASVLSLGRSPLPARPHVVLQRLKRAMLSRPLRL